MTVPRSAAGGLRARETPTPTRLSAPAGLGGRGRGTGRRAPRSGRPPRSARPASSSGSGSRSPSSGAWSSPSGPRAAAAGGPTRNVRRHALDLRVEGAPIGECRARRSPRPRGRPVRLEVEVARIDSPAPDRGTWGRSCRRRTCSELSASASPASSPTVVAPRRRRGGASARARRPGERADRETAPESGPRSPGRRR